MGPFPWVRWSVKAFKIAVHSCLVAAAAAAKKPFDAADMGSTDSFAVPACAFGVGFVVENYLIGFRGPLK